MRLITTWDAWTLRVSVTISLNLNFCLRPRLSLILRRSCNPTTTPTPTIALAIGIDGIPQGGHLIPVDPDNETAGYYNVTCDGEAQYVCDYGPGYDTAGLHARL